MPVTLLVASGDATAIAFSAAMAGPAFAATRGRIHRIDRTSGSHSFAPPADAAWLADTVLAELGKMRG